MEMRVLPIMKSDLKTTTAKLGGTSEVYMQFEGSEWHGRIRQVFTERGTTEWAFKVRRDNGTFLFFVFESDLPAQAFFGEKIERIVQLWNEDRVLGPVEVQP